MSHEDRQWLEGRLVGMEDRIGKRIDESKQESANDLNEFKKVATYRLNSHSNDIRKLQGWRNRIVGAAGVLSLVGTLVGALIGRFWSALTGRGGT